MKTNLRTVLIVCTMAVASLATAASVTVKETAKSNIFNVQYTGQKGKVEVSILGSKNEIVYKEEIKNNGSFIRPYNFSNLPQGDYTIIVKDSNGEHSEKVSYSLDKLINYTHVAPVPNQENKYWLNVWNNGEEIIQVRIVAQDGSVLFEQPVTVNGSYQIVYDLNKVKRNAGVTFEIADSNNQIHTTTFE